MHCNKVSFQELLDCFDNDLGNNLENNADYLEHNAEKLQEILNRIMQRIMSIITSALVHNKEHHAELKFCYIMVVYYGWLFHHRAEQLCYSSSMEDTVVSLV